MVEIVTRARKVCWWVRRRVPRTRAAGRKTSGTERVCIGSVGCAAWPSDLHDPCSESDGDPAIELPVEAVKELILRGVGAYNET
jgi:hypothetical protein